MEIPILCYERGLDSPLVQTPGFVQDALCPELASALRLKRLPTARFWDLGDYDYALGLAQLITSPQTVELNNSLVSRRWGHWQIRQVYIHEVAHHIDYAIRGHSAHDQYFAAAVLVLMSRVPLERLGFVVNDDGTVANLCPRGTFERFTSRMVRDLEPEDAESHLRYLCQIVDDWAYYGESGFAEEAIEGLFNHLAQSTI
ncbi:hypothetical protein BBJ41_00200 [Burkholderia stabilis]|uniref:hypothetical protein n=1 Tax=Burkholderia stabilis TaxID=95485 RepID=UPI000851D563|nr:hypothetical protein [Burkholderia stabilis]AOR66092.1 hypothetical protein BBJ41_00200 [Burkholderia stabilis]HDR9496158.1 hypothetical protein [Burkholderia stabilis]HDR9527647.1 hypothetical protein [Burkholderia stabilis]HDR9534529.1 hypothetical protein [Burkholderia stabilis]HDR9542730.1 hypothetical protein [Burkholderia stabilis]